MKAFAIYTVLRLGLFVTTYAVLAWAWVIAFGEEGMLLVPFLGALVISSLLSLKLLATQRERLAAVIERRAERAASKFEEIRSREDAPGAPVEDAVEDAGEMVRDSDRTARP